MSQALAQQLFMVYAGRATDSASRSSFAGVLGGGQPSAAVLAELYNRALSEGVFSRSDTPQTLVNAIFRNIFGTSASSFEQQAWGSLISNGTLTVQNAAWTIFSSYLGATNVPASYQQPAQARLIAAERYTDEAAARGNTNFDATRISEARTWLSSVSSVATAASQISTVATAVTTVTAAAITSNVITVNTTVTGALLSTNTSNDTLVLNNGANIVGATDIASFENVTISAGATATMTVAQSNTISGKILTLTGQQTITYNDGGTFTGISGVETVNLADVASNVFTVGGTAGVAVNGTGNRADNITGAAGDDNFTGNDGADTLIGLGGADTLTGGNGADVLVGGAGADALAGGADNDSYRWGNITHGTDAITTFGTGTDTLGFVAGAGAFNVTLTDAAAGSHLSAAGTALNAADYVEDTLAALTAGNTNLANARVIVLTQQTNYTNSDGVITAINGGNGTGTDLGTTAVILVYRTAADTYRLSYDADGTTAGGESIIATLGGLTDANIATTLSQANFLFFAS